MSKGKNKRVNLTLHLCPEESQADLRAFTTLQGWYSNIKQEASTQVDATLEMRAFHRNIYLAGLQLQLLNPQLCNHIAESISRQNVTLADLVTELVRCELLPTGTPIGVPVNEVFPEQQLKQLQQSTTAQLAEFASLRKELAQMRDLLERQNLQLTQLRRSDVAQVRESTSNSGPDEMELSDIAAPIEKMKKIREKGIF